MKNDPLAPEDRRLRDDFREVIREELALQMTIGRMEIRTGRIKPQD